MRTTVALVAAAALAGCATPTVVQTVKPGDIGLTCAQLQNEYSDAERFREEADREKGVTGGNIARALLFWPAIVGTMVNANEAMAAADARKVHLANVMHQRNCPLPSIVALGATAHTYPAPVQAAGAVGAPAPAAPGARDPRLPAEMPQVGDTWTYVALDLKFNRHDRSRKFVHTVRSAQPGMIEEVVTYKGALIEEAVFTPQHKALYRRSADMVEIAPYQAAFRSLQPGERWSFLRIEGMEPVHGELPYILDGARVVGTERIAVGAGTFDAVRVDIDGKVSNILTGSSAVIRGYSSFKQTVWYAPSAKRVVRVLAEGPNFSTAYELESYKLN